MVNHTLQGAICRRLHVLGVPAVYHKQFAVLIDRWVRCSGVEWTVKRLKSLKVDLFREKSGLGPLTPAAKRKSGGFKGVIGSLFRWARKSERNFHSVANTFMCYSLFKNQQLTDSQREKWVKAVSANTYIPNEHFISGFTAFMKDQYKNRKQSIGFTAPLLTRSGSDKKAPILGYRSMPKNGSCLASMTYFKTRAHMDLWTRYGTLFAPVTEGVNVHTIYHSFDNDTSSSEYFDTVLGGRICFLQEPGLKLRAIASPYLVLQAALKPLGDALLGHIRTLPWDCTHDQTKPVKIVQSHLSNGRMVHSVDLSSATDYFPLEVQIIAMSAMFGNHPSIDLFTEISRSLWLNHTIGSIRWTQGQPLGLYPSFASFGFSHGMILLYLLGKEYNGQFFVLGDDVVILDDELYAKYISTLDLLGCPYSPDKSLSSNKLAEFAGKVITSKSVVPTFKWREVSNDSFLDIVRNYGRKAVALLSPIQRKVVERVQHLVEPIGLNWSFPGSTREIMTRNTNLIYRQVDRDEQSLTELYTNIHRNIYSVPSELRLRFHNSKRFRNISTSSLMSSVDTEFLLEYAETFDEKVVATFSSIFPEEWVSSIRDNNLFGGYAGTPQAVGNTDLPLVSADGSYLSTLDRYRKLLKL